MKTCILHVNQQWQCKVGSFEDWIKIEQQLNILKCGTFNVLRSSWVGSNPIRGHLWFRYSEKPEPRAIHQYCLHPWDRSTLCSHRSSSSQFWCPQVSPPQPVWIAAETRDMNIQSVTSLSRSGLCGTEAWLLPSRFPSSRMSRVGMLLFLSTSNSRS